VLSDLEAAVAEYRAAHEAVDAAKAQVRASQAHLRAVRSTLQEEIVAAYRAGTRMRDLVEQTGLSREWIRQILRAAGVEPD